MKFIVEIDADALERADNRPIVPDQMKNFIEDALDDAGLEGYSTVEIQYED